jgi:hypothetical protein
MMDGQRVAGGRIVWMGAADTMPINGLFDSGGYFFPIGRVFT